MPVELRDVMTANELRDRYRSVRARLIPPPVATPIVIATLPFAPQPAIEDRPPSILDDLPFERKAALVLSLIPRTQTSGMIGGLCREVMIITANVYGITVDDLLNRSRLHIFSHPRSLAMAICVEILGLSQPKVGWQFGGRDHTTVIQARRKYGALIKTIEAKRNATLGADDAHRCTHT
jgi:hypothetical protein